MAKLGGMEIVTHKLAPYRNKTSLPQHFKAQHGQYVHTCVHAHTHRPTDRPVLAFVICNGFKNVLVIYSKNRMEPINMF